MTVSYFEALEAEIPAIDAERMQRAALAALYPHTSKEGGQRMWRSWTEQINRVREQTGRAAGALFMVDGKAVGLRGLKRWMRKTIGRGAEVA